MTGAVKLDVKSLLCTKKYKDPKQTLGTFIANDAFGVVPCPSHHIT